MGLFGKSSHQRSLESVLKWTFEVFQFLAEGSDPQDKLVYQRQDSPFRLLFFSLCTAHVAGAPTMRNPDAVLNDAMQKLVHLTFAGPPVPQVAANLAAACVEDFLHRYSAWVDIQSSGQAGEGTGVIAGMLRDVEATTPVTREDDSVRLMSLAFGIEDMLPRMREVFK